MSKAEQAALKVYPKSEGIRELKGLSARPIFIQGYEQAKKDYALTAEDIKVIFNEVRDTQNKYCSTEGCYQEVADWFNEQKQKR